jgi:hypothetical protein
VHIYRLVSEHTIEENILKKSDQKRHLDFLAIQSGGFTTDFLQRFDPKAILGAELPGAAQAGDGGAGAEGAAAAGGGGGTAAAAAPVSEEAVRAAMRAAEDEGDAAAAAAVEREAAAEMEEFVREPPAAGEGEGEDGDGGEEGAAEDGGAGLSSQGGAGAEGAGAAPPAAAAADDEAMAEVAALAGGGGGGGAGGDPLAELQAALRPIERYAVRFVELEAPAPDPEAAAALAEEAYRVDEFDVDAIEAAEEERVRGLSWRRWCLAVCAFFLPRVLSSSAPLVHAARAPSRTAALSRQKNNKLPPPGMDPNSPCFVGSPSAPFVPSQEADIDEDEEANVVGDWDQGAATAAYAEQVAAAAEAEREREEAEAAWLEQYGLQYALPEPSSLLADGSLGGGGGGGGGGRGRGRGRGRGGRGRGGGFAAPRASAQDDADTALSPGAWLADGGAGVKRRRPGGALDLPLSAAPAPLPWEPQEDLVLTSTAALLLEQGQLPGANLWTAAADALAAGAAATSVTGVGAAARQGARRGAPACAQRYAQLRAAFAAAADADAGAGGKENLAAGIGALRGQLAAAVGAAALPGPARDALAAVYHVLQAAAAAGDTPAAHRAARLLQALHSLRAALGAAPPPLGHAPPPPGQPPAGPLAQAQALAAAVRAGCGSGAARVISGRLPTVLGAAAAGGAWAAREALEGAAARPGEAQRGGYLPSPTLRSPRPVAPAPLPPPPEPEGPPGGSYLDL